MDTPSMLSFALLLAISTGCSAPSDPAGVHQEAGTTAPTCSAYPDAEPAAPLAHLKSFVVLGDSISAEAVQMQTYADALAKDLDAHYGGVTYFNVGIGGGRTRDIPTELGKLPDPLPTPIAFVVTAGGNDLSASFAETHGENDYYQRIVLAEDMRIAFEILQDPKRFGPLSQKHIYWANVYDPSDGRGNFTSFGCPFWDFDQPTDDLFCRWNGIIGTSIAEHGATLVDFHTLFLGHGFNADPPWFQSDCVHPNELGHEQVRRALYREITGESLD
jgi:lysophospholipase L1-like esterase